MLTRTLKWYLIDTKIPAALVTAIAMVLIAIYASEYRHGESVYTAAVASSTLALWSSMLKLLLGSKLHKRKEQTNEAIYVGIFLTAVNLPGFIVLVSQA